jgi:hypothetical protein
MKNIESFSTEEFTREATQALEDIYEMDIPDWISDHRGDESLYDEVQAYTRWSFAIPEFLKLKWFSKKFKSSVEIEDSINENAIQARSLLSNEGVVKRYICPALTNVSGDALSVTTGLAPTILTLSLTGVISIPVSPILVAVLALMIARAGISTICSGSKKTEEK